MWNLKACTVCLNTGGNLYNIDRCKLRVDYNMVSGLKTQKDNGLPGFLCIVCATYVKRFKSFREKCQRANYTLQELLRLESEITLAHVNAIDREAIGIMPTLSFSDYRRCKYETTKFKWMKMNRPSAPILNEVNIMQCNTKVDLMLEAPPAKKSKLVEVDDYVSSKNLKQEEELEVMVEECSNTEENKLSDEFGTAVNYFDDFIQKDEDSDDPGTDLNVATISEENAADGSTLDEEYAALVPITLVEAKAALEVYNLFTGGKFKCQICNRGYYKESRLEAHAKMHDKHLNGTFLCQLCNFYYKTDFLLTTHMNDKHMYKYICRKCPEVSFDRTTAKQHFIWAHLQLGTKRNANWYESKPSWVRPRGESNARRMVARLRPVRKNQVMPKEYILRTAISPLDQYQLVQDRRKSRNYLSSQFKCELCYRGFREADTYNKHMKKHDKKVCGPLQCDMCKLYFPTTRYMYKHMIVTHIFRYKCQKCEFVCYNRGQATQHYRWHKNVVYKCGQCDLVFKKHSTRLTHIRIKHPSTELCNICGHSYVSSHGLHFHKKKAHTREEIAIGKAACVDKQSSLYCADCQVQFLNDAAYVTHLGSSSKHSDVNLSIQNNELRRLRKQRGHVTRERKPRVQRRRKRAANELIVNNGQATSHDCDLCGLHIPNDVKARQHYQTEHPGHEFLKRYMCDVCGHTTKQYANLTVHMRTHTREKPYACSHCDRRFSMPSNRDRHMVVHTGEKRYECSHCNRRFTQSSAVKLHIQTVHLKIPYAPWDKKNRKRRKEMEAALPQTEPKLMVDATGEYINAYISYEQT